MRDCHISATVEVTVSFLDMIMHSERGVFMNTQVSKSTLLKWGISIALAIICLLIPEQGFFTAQVRTFLTITIFFLALTAFELVPELFIGILLPASYLWFKVAPANVVMSPWVGSTVIMIVGMFVLATSLEECGLLKRLAFFLMCKVKSNYTALLFAIMFVGVLINILTSGRAYLIMPPLCLGLCVSLGCIGRKMGVGIATACLLGSCTSHAFTFQPTVWGIIFSTTTNYVSNTAVTPLNIIFYCWPILLIMCLILFIVSKWYKPDQEIGTLDYFKNELKAMGAVSRREKVNAVVLGILLVYIFTISITGLDLNLGFAVIPFLLFLPFVDGADTNTVFQKINWSMFFMFTAFIAIGTVASNLGIGQILSQLCLDIVTTFGNNVFTVFGLIFAVVFALNFLMTPTAIYALISEPMCIVAQTLGYSVVPFLLATNACSEAILLPYEYIPYLIVFSFGMMSMKDFIKTNILRSLLFFGGFLLLVVPYWMLIGLL